MPVARNGERRFPKKDNGPPMLKKNDTPELEWRVDGQGHFIGFVAANSQYGVACQGPRLWDVTINGGLIGTGKTKAEAKAIAQAHCDLKPSP